MVFPEALPHDPLKQLAEDLFVVYGSVQLLPIARISRNMAVVRHQGELTLINAVRMDEAGLQELDALGQVRHVLRLGPLHGIDDPFYVDRYNADFWSFEGGTTYTNPAIVHPLAEGGALPFPNARLFAFSHLKEPEGAILLQYPTGVLLTCDAVQSYSTPPHKPYTAWLTKRLLPLVGFPDKTIIGPIWVKMLAEDRDGIRSEFERLLDLDFDQLLSAHGTFLARNAHTELEQAFQKMFG
jgi:hypothetical protein